MKNLRKFVFSALLLCGVSFLMKTVGVSFNVYVSNRAGAEAMGLYSLLSGVYGFALTFATSGISLATMRLVAEAIGVGDALRVKKSLKCCLIYSLSFGGAASETFGVSPFLSVVRLTITEEKFGRSPRMLTFAPSMGMAPAAVLALITKYPIPE